MTQGVFAKEAGVSRSTVSAIEKGASISLISLLKIANALEIDPSTLLKEPGKEEINISFDSYVRKIAQEENKILYDFLHQILGRLDKLDKK